MENWPGGIELEIPHLWGFELGVPLLPPCVYFDYAERTFAEGLNLSVPIAKRGHKVYFWFC
jgi:hypothetical protein